MFQCKKHKNLSKDERRRIAQQTRLVGEVWVGENTKGTNMWTRDEKLLTEEGNEGKKEEGDKETEKTPSPSIPEETPSPSVVREINPEVNTTGRQRFGNTRNLPMYPLDTPILASYMK